ncbi:MAG: hypothetical protein LH472_15175 [Pyrinomonadaceae bacterium]|nr:hypothetical protein [Pyrinomonadaceae bacterium]
MQTIYQINADELDQNLLDSIKALFKHKEIEIVISERDETAYLRRSPANRERLLRAVKDVEENLNIVVPNQEQFHN